MILVTGGAGFIGANFVFTDLEGIIPAGTVGLLRKIVLGHDLLYYQRLIYENRIG